jgi:hypothetical protein
MPSAQSYPKQANDNLDLSTVDYKVIFILRCKYNSFLGDNSGTSE